MKIKLNRELWGKKEGEIINAPNDLGLWAIRKNYATEVLEPIEPKPAKKVIAETKVIEPKYKRNAN